jgi:hypothetical protein
MQTGKRALGRQLVDEVIGDAEHLGGLLHGEHKLVHAAHHPLCLLPGMLPKALQTL